MQSSKEGATEMRPLITAISRQNHAVQSSLQPGDTVTPTPTELTHQSHKHQIPLMMGTLIPFNTATERQPHTEQLHLFNFLQTSVKYSVSKWLFTVSVSKNPIHHSIPETNGITYIRIQTLYLNHRTMKDNNKPLCELVHYRFTTD